MSVRYKLEELDDRIILRLEGRIGGEASALLYSDIKNIIGDHEDKHLVLDFQGVEFIDSSGLGSLVAVNSHLVKKKKKLFLRSVPANLQSLLKVTNLTKILNIEKTT